MDPISHVCILDFTTVNMPVSISACLCNNVNNTPLGLGRHHGGRGRHNVARGRHIFQWHEARGVILTLLYRQADIDTGILTVVKSNMQTCDIGSNVRPRANIGSNVRPPCSTDFKKFQILPWQMYKMTFTM